MQDNDISKSLLPRLPLPIPLADYIENIRDEARSLASGNHVEVDRYLCQNEGTEKQLQYRKRKNK